MELICRLCFGDVEQGKPVDAGDWMPRDRIHYRHRMSQLSLCTESGIDAQGKNSPIPTLPVEKRG